MSANERTQGKPAARASESAERKQLVRLYGFGVACVLGFALIALRLWMLQIVHGEDLAKRAERQHQDVIEVAAERGAIYDRRGEPLAMSSSVESIAVFPKKIKNPELVASLLGDILGEDPGVIEPKLRASRFQWIKRLAEPGEVERVRALNLQGLHFEPEHKRYYPKGSVASHVLGFVSLEHEGQGGVELSFQELLAGKPGLRHVYYDAARNRYEGTTLEPAEPGGDLFLTLDESIQAVAEERLAEAIRETRARSGSIVVMDPENGDVLAMANWPTFDPNVRPRDAADLAVRQNFAISGLYEPGSTFKLVSVAGALAEGITDPEEIIDCQMGKIYIGRIRMRDHKAYGLLPVKDIVANSSNVGVIKLAQRLGAEGLYDYVRRFGFGETTGIELPGEIPGLVRKLEEWRDISVAAVSIGQEIGVTPLQVARAYSAAANGGYLVQARIVDAIRKPNGEIERFEPGPKTRIVSAEVAAQMRAMLERTVVQGTARLAQTAGYRVAGKTGTAQVFDQLLGAYSNERYIASFAGFAPLNDPSFVAVIMLDSPVGQYYGGQVAAPIFPKLAGAALRFRDVPPSEPLEPRRPERKRKAPPAAELADLAIIGDRRPEPVEPQTLRDADGAILVAGLGEAAAPGKDADAAPDVKEGRRARLRVTGVVTPDLYGLTVREALTRSAAAGLKVASRGAGVVIRQQPAPGSPLPRGGVVEVEFGRLTAQGGGGR